MSRSPLRPRSLRAAGLTTGLASLLLLGGALIESGCKTRPLDGIRIARKPKKAEPAATAAQALAPPADPDAPDERYQKFVRPLLNKHACTSGSCHGTFKGGGLYFSSSLPSYKPDYQMLLSRLDRKEPEKSELVRKATGQMAHNGGRNLDEKSCDYRRLIAWIGQRPDIDCSDDPPPDPERVARDVLPTLHALGCAGSCHTEPGKARDKFDLSAMVGKEQNPTLVRLQIEYTRPNHYSPWDSPILRVVLGQDGVHKAASEPLACGYRRLYNYIAKAPEADCTLPGSPAPATPPPPLPDLQAFTNIVQPTLAKRGCFDVGCHGGGAGGLVMFEPSKSGQPTALHDYFMLLTRVEDLNKLDDSTLLRTARNIDVHGGGKRLGGKGDCVDEMLVSWLRGKPVAVCPPPQPPSYARYVSEVQGIIDRMTCSSMQCHGASIPSFVLLPFPKDPKVIRANYERVLKQIDYDFMPFSPIQLRMREPCAYARVGAWIEGKPAPDCPLRDPDPSIFPRRDRMGNLAHPKFDEPPPPALPAGAQKI